MTKIDLTLPKFLDRSRPEVRERHEKGAKLAEQARIKMDEERARKRAEVEEKLRAEIEEEAQRERKLSKPVQKLVSKPITDPKRRASDYDLNAVIRVVVEGNPKKVGSKGFDKFAAIRDGMLVGEYLNTTLKEIEGKWQKGELRYCLEKGFIKLEG